MRTSYFGLIIHKASWEEGLELGLKSGRHFGEAEIHVVRHGFDSIGCYSWS